MAAKSRTCTAMGAPVLIHHGAQDRCAGTCLTIKGQVVVCVGFLDIAVVKRAGGDGGGKIGGYRGLSHPALAAHNGYSQHVTTSHGPSAYQRTYGNARMARDKGTFDLEKEKDIRFIA